LGEVTLTIKLDRDFYRRHERLLRRVNKAALLKAAVYALAASGVEVERRRDVLYYVDKLREALCGGGGA